MDVFFREEMTGLCNAFKYHTETKNCEMAKVTNSGHISTCKHASLFETTDADRRDTRCCDSHLCIFVSVELPGGPSRWPGPRLGDGL